MSWITPKTDWVSTDYFNIEDYNRIIGNISYLKTLADELFYMFPDIYYAGNEKTYESMYYASEINNIEYNLGIINNNSYNFNIGDTIFYQANQSTPLWSEYNRIESACLLLYNTMIAQQNALTKLAFILGNQKGLKV